MVVEEVNEKLLIVDGAVSALVFEFDCCLAFVLKKGTTKILWLIKEFGVTGDVMDVCKSNRSFVVSPIGLL